LSRSKNDIFATVKVRLPKYLAEWIQVYASEMGMDIGQLLTQILHHYYVAYIKGVEKGQEGAQTVRTVEAVVSGTTIDESRSVQTQKSQDITALAEKFTEELKDRKWLVREFVKWLQSRNIAIPSEVHVNEFIDEYLKTHNITKTTLKRHRSILRKFVRFVQQATSAS